MPHPDVLGYGGRDYGNRVGLWRMFEVLDKHNVRCTVSLSMSVIEMYPEILEAMEARRWEYMSHGYFNTRYHWGYSEEEEREILQYAKQKRTLADDAPIKELSREDRELLLADAALLTHADGEQSEDEQALLQKLIGLLEFSEADAKQILESVHDGALTLSSKALES